MTYKAIHKARTRHQTRLLDGTQTTKYSPYEIGIISGDYRDMMAVVADSAGFDGLGFDSNVGSHDDSWHVLSVLKGARYVDSLAIGGALDKDHAVEIAKSQMDHLGGDNCVLITGNTMQFDGMAHNCDTWSIDAISKLMNNPTQNKPFLPLVTASELNHESTRVCFDSAVWGDGIELKSHGAKVSRLHLDMVRADSRHELNMPFDLAQELAGMDAMPLEEQAFDALMDTENRLDLLQTRLFNSLKRAGSDELSVETVTRTKPFKRQGVANIAIVFGLSDGQTLSIWFHNPDKTPANIKATDIMISWKWMLNKRDVTAALSPKQVVSELPGEVLAIGFDG